MSDDGASGGGGGHSPRKPNNDRFRVAPVFDHGKRIFRCHDLETVGLSPASFRMGGKKHVPAPYSHLESAAEVIAAQSCMPSERSPRTPAGRPNTTGGLPVTPRGVVATPDAIEEASSRRRERRLIESLIAFPTKTGNSNSVSKHGVPLPSVPRAFQTGGVDWRPNGPHDHIPPLPETPAKPPHAKLERDDDGFVKLDPRLYKSPRHTKPLPRIPQVSDKLKEPANPTALVERLWVDIEHRKKRLDDKRAKQAKEDAAMVKYKGKDKVTEENREDFIQRFQTQPLHSREVKKATLTRKYAPPLTKKRVLQPDEMKASTDRLYSQSVKKFAEAQERAFQEHVEKTAPKFAKLTPEEVRESAARLSSKEPPVA